jgi:hypothetical protein
VQGVAESKRRRSLRCGNCSSAKWRTRCIRKKKLRGHAAPAWCARAARGPLEKREHAEIRVRTVGKQKYNAHSVATHAHAGWPKATYSRKITDSMADVGAHTNGRSQSQHVTSTHECQIYIVQQNQLPIHRTTIERPAAVENLKKHRHQTQKPSNPLTSAPYAAPAAATIFAPTFAPSCAAAATPFATSFAPSCAAAATTFAPSFAPSCAATTATSFAPACCGKWWSLP